MSSIVLFVKRIIYYFGILSYRLSFSFTSILSIKGWKKHQNFIDRKL